MSWSRAPNLLWNIALCLMIFGCSLELIRSGHIVFGSALSMALVGALVSRAHLSTRKTTLVGIEITGDWPPILRDLPKADQLRIAHLAASGRAIEAIALTRDLLHVSLRAAKDAVDQLTTPPR